MAAAGLVVASLLAGCSNTSDSPAPTAPAAVAPSASAAEPPVDEPPGAIVCGKAVDAVRGATLMNPGVVTDISGAAGTADAPVADAAQELSGAYAKAVAARDTGNEPDAVAAVSAAAAELIKVCGDSGLGTVG